MGGHSKGKSVVLWTFAGLALLVGMYCLLGAVMNGSFAVAAETPEPYRSNARVFTYLAWGFVAVAAGCAVAAVRARTTKSTDVS